MLHVASRRLRLACAFQKNERAFFSVSKIFPTAEDAIRDVVDGSKILLGGFGLCGIPENLIRALKEKNTKNLTLVSSNAGTDDGGVGILITNKQV